MILEGYNENIGKFKLVPLEKDSEDRQLYQQDIIKKIKSIIKNNNGYLIKDIKIGDNLYCLKPFDRSKFSFESVKSLYSNYYINAMVTSIVPMNDESYRQKLEHFVNLNEKFGFGLFNVCRQKDNYSIGLYGLKLREGADRELELAYVVKIGSIVKPLSEIMIPFVFETFGINKLHGEILSYNKESQIIVKQIGMVESGIYICNKNYIKDSYFTNFILTKQKFNLIKSLNDKKYKLINFSNKIPLEDIHNKARSLYTALKDFENNQNYNKFKYCKQLIEYKEKCYPRVCAKEKIISNI